MSKKKWKFDESKDEYLEKVQAAGGVRKYMEEIHLLKVRTRSPFASEQFFNMHCLKKKK